MSFSKTSFIYLFINIDTAAVPLPLNEKIGNFNWPATVTREWIIKSVFQPKPLLTCRSRLEYMTPTQLISCGFPVARYRYRRLCLTGNKHEHLCQFTCSNKKPLFYRNKTAYTNL